MSKREEKEETAGNSSPPFECHLPDTLCVAQVTKNRGITVLHSTVFIGSSVFPNEIHNFHAHCDTSSLLEMALPLAERSHYGKHQNRKSSVPM